MTKTRVVFVHMSAGVGIQVEFSGRPYPEQREAFLRFSQAAAESLDWMDDGREYTSAEPTDGYRDAFFKIAEVLDIPAMPVSPKEAFETVMLPKLRALVEPPVRLRKWPGEPPHCPSCDCGINESLDSAAEVLRQGRQKINAALAEPASREASPQAPIVRVNVHNDRVAGAIMYAPGLPEGEHDLYCEPTSVAPALKSAAVVLQIEDGFTKLDGYLGKIYTCSVHGRSETQCDHWPVAKSTEGHK